MQDPAVRYKWTYVAFPRISFSEFLLIKGSMLIVQIGLQLQQKRHRAEQAMLGSPEKCSLKLKKKTGARNLSCNLIKNKFKPQFKICPCFAQNNAVLPSIISVSIHFSVQTNHFHAAFIEV